MKDGECISPELQGILDEFARVRDAYVALEAYCNALDETLSFEKERSDKMKENLEKLWKTYLFLQKRHKSTVDDLQTEKEVLRKTIEELKEQCDHLRLIATDRNGNEEQIFRLRDEVEVLKTQLVLQEEKYNEDVALLKQQHSDEIQKYKNMLLPNAKQKVATSQNRKRQRPKDASKSKKNTSCFRWPKLDIEKVNNTPMDDEEEIGSRDAGNKKKKLFREDNDTAINIV